MAKNYRELGRQAEDAVRGIRDKDLRREAFRILLLQFMAGSRDDNGGNGSKVKYGTGRPVVQKKQKKSAQHPGRRGGSVATVVIQQLIDNGSFKGGRDAAGIMKELAKKKIRLEPSQLRMVLLRFSRIGKLKRRVKMKGKKVTYLYSSR